MKIRVYFTPWLPDNGFPVTVTAFIIDKESRYRTTLIDSIDEYNIVADFLNTHFGDHREYTYTSSDPKVITMFLLKF